MANLRMVIPPSDGGNMFHDSLAMWDWGRLNSATVEQHDAFGWWDRTLLPSREKLEGPILDRLLHRIGDLAAQSVVETVAWLAQHDDYIFNCYARASLSTLREFGIRHLVNPTVRWDGRSRQFGLNEQAMALRDMEFSAVVCGGASPFIPIPARVWLVQ